MTNLHNKVVIVTGAGRGIGAATAIECAHRRATVVLVARSEDQLRQTLEACLNAQREAGLSAGRSLIVPIDLSKQEAPSLLFQKTLDAFGRVDGLINNAGQFTGGPIETVTSATFDKDIAINVKAPYFLCQEAFRSMTSGGAIVNISSVAGIRSSSKFPGSSVYSMTKFAIVGMTEVLATEGRAKSIQVNCIAPGAFETQMLKTFNPHIRTSSQATDLAQIVAHTLELSLCAKLTGTTIEVPTEMWIEK